jgi:hypothetical protein
MAQPARWLQLQLMGRETDGAQNCDTTHCASPGQLIHICLALGSDCGEHKDDSLLGYCAV